MNSEGKASTLEEMEVEYVEFLKTRIQRGGGSIPLTHLSGHLSQLRFELRDSFGTSPAQLAKLLRKYPDMFKINDNGFVLLTEGSVDMESHTQSHKSRRDSSCSSVKSEKHVNESLPRNIENGEGIIIRLFPQFGFMKVIKPARLNKNSISVYFAGDNFKQKESMLSKFDLHHQQVLGFNAVRGNNNSSASYKATHVWILSDNKNGTSFANSRKNHDTGLYDPIKLDGEGVIQKVFPKSGFIEIDGNPKNTVYFHLNHVCKFENLIDLSQVIKKGDPVIFSAIRSTRNDVTARWEATQVWLKKNSTSKEKSNNSGSSKENVREDSCNAENRLNNAQGLLFASKNGVAIKFGPKFTELANADSSLFYMYESKVIDILWEFEDGQNVNFDAIREKSPLGWKAVLVWVGKKPNIDQPSNEVKITHDDIYERDIVNPCNNEVSKKSYQAKAETNRTKSELVNEDVNSNSKHYHNDVSKKSYSMKAQTNNTKSDLVKEYVNSSYKQSKSNKSAKFNKSIPNLKGRKGTLPGFNECLSSKSSCSSNSLNSNTPKKDSIAYSHSSRESSHTPTSEESSVSCTARSRASSQSSVCSSKSFTTCNNLEEPKLLEEHSNLLPDISNSEEPKLQEEHSKLLPDISNWGDTPYSDDEELNSAPYSSDCGKNSFQQQKTESLSKKTWSGSHSDVDNTVPMLNGIECDVVDMSSPNDTFPADKFSQFENDDDNAILNFIQEKKMCLEENHPNENVEENHEEVDISMDKKYTECKAYIKEFKGIKGTVKKIYSRFAEIENNKLSKPVAFFLSDFYRNGVSVDSHFDDLKEVVKSGDCVYFNCFEIMDDESNCWQKVTVVWKGKEPKIEKQLSPAEFIAEHGLKVTVARKKPRSKVENSKEKLSNSSSNVSLTSKPKFLTENNLTNAEQCVQNLDIDKHQQETLPTAKPELLENNVTSKLNKWIQLNSILNDESMVQEISNIFEHRGFEHSALLDKACAEVIQYLFHKNSLEKKSKQSSSKKAYSSTAQSDILKPLMMTTGVQTFVTGEVGSQFIYPH